MTEKLLTGTLSLSTTNQLTGPQTALDTTLIHWGNTFKNADIFCLTRFICDCEKQVCHSSLVLSAELEVVSVLHDKLLTRAGVKETLCPQHMFDPKDNPEITEFVQK